MSAPPAPVTVWILGDQLLEKHPALLWAEERVDRSQIRVVVIENRQRRSVQRYHRQKLVFLLGAMFDYTKQLQQAGFSAEYRVADSFGEGLRGHCAAQGTAQVVTMAASHYAGRIFQQERLAPLLGLPVTVLPNSQFLTERFNPFPNPEPGKRYVMENFYRAMRRRFGLLMDGDEPVGGAWNYDKENRKPLPKNHPQPPPLPSFPPNEDTQSILDRILAEEDAPYVGNLTNFNLGINRAQALAALDDFITHRLPLFGPYEDAMSSQHPFLWHSFLTPYLNVGLLEPLECATAAIRAYEDGHAPLNSVEGFVRQIVGWREFMYWQYWRQMPGFREQNAWGHHRNLPPFFWDGETRMNCMKHAIQRALDHGYAHHIERLMLLSNYAMLAQLDPAQVNDWFMAMFVDAYEWVMLPNVIGMGLNADGGVTATKPYIASANYINKMSDYCQGCWYNKDQRTGERACPFNLLYWNFLIENEEKLRRDPRLGRNVLGLRHLDEAERAAVRAQAQAYLT